MRVLPALGLLAALAGCGPSEPGFKINDPYILKVELQNGEDYSFSGQQVRDVNDAVTMMFGTPNTPHVPQLDTLDTSEVLSIDLLRRAAGPVKSDEFGTASGLFREHCAHCHGVSGDGVGPTAAFLNPYPRDFRPGMFKFKRTTLGSKPTDEDLHRTLMEGIPGTAMPSFRLLRPEELAALIEYVKYLAIRGEVERKLIEASGGLNVEEGERLFDLTDNEKLPAQVADLRTAAGEVFQSWADAPENVVEIEPRPEGWDDPEALAASIDRGREVFFGKVANCWSCHGESALGDGQTDIYDKWTEEFEPKNPPVARRYVDVGALPPRKIQPRNLRLGVYRGGRRPIDHYWRIFSGIEGTPMPGVSAAIGQNQLTVDDLWSLIDYVRNLPNEPISKARHEEEIVNERILP